MRDKKFRTLEKIVDSYIFEVHTYFLAFNLSFRQQIQELNSRSHGGYEFVRYVDNFCCDVNRKRIELLERIELLFAKTGRKLSSKQHNCLINKCSELFDKVITDYQTLLKDEVGCIDSIEICLQSLKSINNNQINNYIEALEILSRTNLDKALLWTAFGVIISATLSLISIICGFLL